MCSSIILNQNVDPGRDGASTSLSGQPNNPNEVFANDVIAFALHYYDQFDYEDENGNLVTTNDYSPIGGGGLTPLISVLPAANITNSDVAANTNDLFNGNIKSMQSTLTNPTTHNAMPMANAYQYDQLNRLLSSKSFVNLTGNQWGNSGSYDNRYLNTFEYDAMGNIVHQNRYTEAGVQIENMDYGYKKDASGNLLRNRLYNINDSVDSLVNDSDIDDMDGDLANDLFNPQNQNIESDYNYAYDEEGRLIRDNQEKIDEIIWRVDGKVKEIWRPSGSGKKNISFDYDAMGNRIAKNVFDDDWNLISSTYYILDAQGNQINVYEHEVDSNNVLYTLKERHIYGSSSLGIKTDSIGMYFVANNQNLNTELGLKSYSLSNHLGNVLTVISDVKIPQSTDGINVSGSWVGIRNISDYSPFGVLLKERTVENDFFRASFQYQEHDDEVKGKGNSVNFKYRMHDPRVGRFFAVDPLNPNYPRNSPYSFSENRVIDAIELEGLELTFELKFAGRVTVPGVHLMASGGIIADSYGVHLCYSLGGMLLVNQGAAASIQFSVEWHSGAKKASDVEGWSLGVAIHGGDVLGVNAAGNMNWSDDLTSGYISLEAGGGLGAGAAGSLEISRTWVPGHKMSWSELTQNRTTLIMLPGVKDGLKSVSKDLKDEIKSLSRGIKQIKQELKENRKTFDAMRSNSSDYSSSDFDKVYKKMEGLYTQYEDLSSKKKERVDLKQKVDNFIYNRKEKTKAKGKFNRGKYKF